LVLGSSADPAVVLALPTGSANTDRKIKLLEINNYNWKTNFTPLCKIYSGGGLWRSKLVEGIDDNSAELIAKEPCSLETVRFIELA
jgi:hypothetical protein